MSDTQAKVDGIAKFDLFAPEGKDACVGRVTFPKGCYGGEAFFTPRHQDPALCDGGFRARLGSKAADVRVGRAHVAWDPSVCHDCSPACSMPHSPAP